MDQTIRDAVSSMGREVVRSMEIKWREQIDSQLPGLVARERMERSIIESARPTASPVRAIDNQSSQTPRFARLGEDMHRAFKENAQINHRDLQEYSERVHANEVHHTEAMNAQAQVLDVMVHKIDKLSGLVDQMQKTHIGNGAPNTPPPKAPSNQAVAPSTPIHPTAVVLQATTKGAPPNTEAAAQSDAPKKTPSFSSSESGGKPVRSVSTRSVENGEKSGIAKVASSVPFEIGFGFLIILSTVKMCVEAEYQGWAVAQKLGIDGYLTTAQATTENSDMLFYIIEFAFGVVFTIEIGVKFAAELWPKFFKSGWNIFDSIIIGVAWFTMFVEVKLPVKPMMLRLFRLLRLLRLLKVLSKYEVFDDLQLMVRALQGGLPVLLWVVLLMGPLLACTALFMTYTLGDFINDDTQKLEDRIKVFHYFGTFSRAFLSMFEVTFGSWVPICRFLQQKVDERFALFFMAHQLCIGIAVLRIVYGVFLHVTFRCVHNNEELLIAQKMRAEKKFNQKIHGIFKRFDTSGSGGLSWPEFLKIAEDERVKTLLSALDIDLADAETIFKLSNLEGDELSPDEMINGFSKLKGFAKSVDVGQMLSRQTASLAKMDKLLALNYEIGEKVDADMIKIDGIYAKIDGDR